MSFWSKLGKIGAIAGAGAAAIGTMGAASPALAGAIGLGAHGAGILGGIGAAANAAAPVLGKLSAGRAEGKVADSQSITAQNNAMQERGQNLNAALLQEFQNKLGLKTTESNLMDTRLNQTRQGDLQHNVQDVVIPDNERVKVMHWSGGMRPSALGPNARAAGEQVSNSALASLGHENLPMAPNMVGNIPNLLDQPKAGVLDHILGVATPALSLYAALNPTKKPQPQMNEIPNPDPAPTYGQGGWV